MSASASSYTQPLSARDSLRASKLSLTLKFGLNQTKLEYSTNDRNRSIVELLYSDAEKWLWEILSSANTDKPVGHYVINLYQISSTDFEMVPIRQSSVLEQNSLVELVLVPVEVDGNPHYLCECQFTEPTYCAKCTRFIAGYSKQGYRCRKCNRAYHKNCAPFLGDDCLIEARATDSKPILSTFINPFSAASELSSAPAKSANNDKKLPEEVRRLMSNITENSIIDKGIFPACILGTQSPGRYLFRLTTTKLSISVDLSPQNFALTLLPISGDSDYVISLADIEDLVLTHKTPHRDDVFEVRLRDTTVLSVGKRTDPEPQQMDAAQFYSFMREQRETLANTTSPTSNSNHLPKLRGIKSNFCLGDQELHERYAFIGERIGEGGFGCVVGAIKKATGEPRAVKIIEKRDCSEQDIRLINEEAGHLFRFNHINILKLEAYYERKEAVYLVTERMEKDMCEYIINSPNHYLEEDTCRILIYQVIVALRYLHDNGCAHLDVKCENILISMLKPVPAPTNSAHPPAAIGPDRDYPLVKLADFGYSREIGEHSFRKTRVGTIAYNPPEMLMGNVKYNRLADMWSAGVVMYAALSGSMPFSETSCSDIEQIELEKKDLFSNARWASVSDDAQLLIQNHLLVIRVDSRARANDVLFHNWFSDFQLFKDLREIERRTKYMMRQSQQEITPSTKWLRAQRGDLVWLEYQANCH